VPCTEMRSIADGRRRLVENRRRRLASLGMWPELPHLKNGYRAWSDEPMVNAAGRAILGLMHEGSHPGQIGEIVPHAQDARGGTPAP
jgi:hypothetical protein